MKKIFILVLVAMTIAASTNLECDDH